jgi:tagaturonate reductase
MHKEIAPAIPFTIDIKVKEDFANNTFERFCNPFIDHQWQSITVQYTSKMKMRNLPLLQRHYELGHSVPLHMAAGFAAFLLYMKVTKKAGNKFFGQRNSEEYEIKDDAAEYFCTVWSTGNGDKVAADVLGNEELWEMDLTKLPGFLQAVQELLQDFTTHGVLHTIGQLETKKVTA